MATIMTRNTRPTPFDAVGGAASSAVTVWLWPLVVEQWTPNERR
jgi:hypothetical protein